MKSISKPAVFFRKVGFQLSKRSPEILLAVGLIGVVAGAVVACKSTTKASAIVERTKSDLDAVHECLETGDEGYDAEIAKKDTAIIYTHTVVDFVKLYAPAVGIFAVSVACILVSHNILNKRYLSVSAVYAAANKAFSEYRSRVTDRFGKEVDNELRYNVKAKELEKKTVDENGNEVVEKKNVNAANADDDYISRCFDELNPFFEKTPSYNVSFLKNMQCHANTLLHAQGYLFLNDVYDLLGFPKTKLGHVVGWKLGAKNSDHFVDFGIFESTKPEVLDFLRGEERSVWLDFNVDGNIFSQMSDYKYGMV